MWDTTMKMSLWLATVFNLLAAVAVATPHGWLGRLLELPAQPAGAYTILLAYFIGLFAAMYGWLALRFPGERPLLVLGALGKLGAAVALTGLWLNDALSAPLLAAGVGDGCFALFWLVWLRSTPGTAQDQPRCEDTQRAE